MEKVYEWKNDDIAECRKDFKYNFGNPVNL